MVIWTDWSYDVQNHHIALLPVAEVRSSLNPLTMEAKPKY